MIDRVNSLVCSEAVMKKAVVACISSHHSGKQETTT